MLPDDDNRFLTYDHEVAELAVLLPCQQAEGLEHAAQQRGLTVAQMVRRLIQDFLRGAQGSGPEMDASVVRRWA